MSETIDRWEVWATNSAGNDYRVSLGLHEPLTRGKARKEASRLAKLNKGRVYRTVRVVRQGYDRYQFKEETDE